MQVENCTHDVIQVVLFHAACCKKWYTCPSTKIHMFQYKNNLKMHHFPYGFDLGSDVIRLNWISRSLFIKIDSSKKCIGFYLSFTIRHLIKKLVNKYHVLTKKTKFFFWKLFSLKHFFQRLFYHWGNFFLSENRNNIQASRCVLFRKLFLQKVPNCILILSRSCCTWNWLRPSCMIVIMNKENNNLIDLINTIRLFK